MGSRHEGGVERPRAVSEYLVERMIRAGATKIGFVISPGKSDIVEYYGGDVEGARTCYVVQPDPSGLCDAIFRMLPFVRSDEEIVVGLPDTVWFPVDGLTRLPAGAFSFLLFPVKNPELFDAVVCAEDGAVRAIEVKSRAPRSHWIWGAFRLTGSTLAALHALWVRRLRADEYLGTLVNAFIAEGNTVLGVRGGESYVDVGTLHGYREGMRLLGERTEGTNGRDR